MQLTKQQLTNINGGGFNWNIAYGIALAATFIYGVIDGYRHPNRCN